MPVWASWPSSLILRSIPVSTLLGMLTNIYLVYFTKPPPLHVSHLMPFIPEPKQIGHKSPIYFPSPLPWHVRQMPISSIGFTLSPLQPLHVVNLSLTVSSYVPPTIILAKLTPKAYTILIPLVVPLECDTFDFLFAFSLSSSSRLKNFSYSYKISS